MNKNSYCVIMGGGVGSRFWPMSRDKKPKQFLDLFGTGKSLLRMTFDRFSKFIPKENIIIVTNEIYLDTVKEHIPDIKECNILLEPMRRNTAPAIAYATYHIKSMDANANIVVAPSDHMILDEDAFSKSMNIALEYADKNDCLITLGVKPSRPETEYGYIQMKTISDIDNITEVKTFTEKPNAEMAQIFLDSGEFLWNSGMFVWNINSIMNAISTYIPDLCSIMDSGESSFGTEKELDFIKDNFAKCPTISIDYGVMEKSDNVMVLPVDFGWADLGTWGSLYDLNQKDENENVSLSSKSIFNNSKGNIVSGFSEERIVVLNGIDDCIVCEAGNVLMISKRNAEDKIKQLISDSSDKYGDNYK